MSKYIRKSVLAYLAGIIDGEGCIRFDPDRTSTGKLTGTIVIMVNMLDPTIPLLFKEIFGGFYRVHTRRDFVTKADVHMWTSKAKKAGNVLERLIPFLIIKKEQAKLALDVIEFKNSPRRRMKAPITKKEEAKYAEFYLKFKELNKRGERKAYA